MYVSIISPVYNGAETISELIESLMDQKYPRVSHEIIIVDNGSTDNTAEIIRTYSGVRYVFEEVASSYAARNAGAKVARGDILAFIDSDSRADKLWLLEAVKLMKRYDIVGGMILNKDSEKYYLALFDEIIVNANRELSVKNKKIYGGNFFLKKVLFAEMGGFDSNVISGGDTLLSSIALQRGYSIGFAEKAVVYHPVDGFIKRFRRSFRIGSGSQMKRAVDNKENNGRITSLLERIFRERLLLQNARRGAKITEREYTVLWLLSLLILIFDYLGAFLGSILQLFCRKYMVRW
ncbi:glycosyltransferase [bacterium]|nr:glycosyltransferase [bacterium]